MKYTVNHNELSDKAFNIIAKCDFSLCKENGLYCFDNRDFGYFDTIEQVNEFLEGLEEFDV